MVNSLTLLAQSNAVPSDHEIGRARGSEQNVEFAKPGSAASARPGAPPKAIGSQNSGNPLSELHQLRSDRKESIAQLKSNLGMIKKIGRPENDESEDGDLS